MLKLKPATWGAWILERSRVVGFATQGELSKAVGCTRQQLQRWLKFTSPPNQMRRGYDGALARALQTDRAMLLHDYVSFSPADAPRVQTPPGRNAPFEAEYPDDDRARIACMELLGVLRGELLQKAKRTLIELAAEQIRRPDARLDHLTDTMLARQKPPA